jgi:hypothetical protein
MNRRHTALVALIAACWLAITGSALLIWWVLLDGHLWHLTAGSISLTVAVAACAFALNSIGMSRH